MNALASETDANMVLPSRVWERSIIRNALSAYKNYEIGGNYMLFAYYACPECGTRIGVKISYEEFTKIQNYQRTFSKLNFKAFRCPVCNIPRVFDYVGYEEVRG